MDSNTVEEYSEEYERGYQDGQMDIEEELAKVLLSSSSLEMDNRLGWDLLHIKITTTTDSYLYRLLMTNAKNTIKAQKTTESVVPEAPKPTKPQIIKAHTAKSEAKQPKKATVSKP